MSSEFRNAKMEEAVRQSEQHYQLLFETMHQGVVYHKADGTIISMNPSAARILGKTPEEFLGSSSVGQENFTIREDGSPFPGIEHPAMVALRTGLEVHDVVMGVFIPRDDCYRWINIDAIPLFKPGEDKPYQVYTLFDDITERKRIEEALHESEDRYHNLFETMNEGFILAEVITDEQGKPVDYRFLDVNPAGERFFRRSCEEIVGQTYRIIGGADADPEWIKVLCKVALTGEAVSIDRYAPVGGHWVHLFAYSPRARQFAAIFDDITERKHSEENLLESEEKYKLLFENANDGVVLHELTTEGLPGDILQANEAICQMLGYTKEEMYQLKPMDLQVEGSDEASEELHKVLTHEKNILFERNLVAKDGRIIPVEFHTSVVDLHGNPAAISIIRDVTERKKAAEALLENQRVLAEAQRIAHLGSWRWNAETGRLSRSDEFYRILGIEPAPGEPAALSFIDYIHPGDREMVKAAINATLTEGRPHRLEARIVRPDGSVRVVLEQTGEIEWDAKGKLLRVIGTMQDITEQKKAEEELRKSRDELEQRVEERTAELSDAKENLETINEELQVEISEHENTEKNLLKAKETAEAAVEAKSAFLANMSHELRTPMNAVIGFSNLLLDDSLTPDQKDYIERIKVGGEALLGLINDILDFSKMEKNRAQLEHQPLSLRSLVDESLDMVVVQARDKGLNLAFTINYGTPDTIIGDHGRLRQILVNLLSNAIKFTDDGEVSVSISSKMKENSRHQILFAVRDTGIGIPEGKIDTLFQPFSQVETTISSHRGGTGLGLAISKRLVELMGGKIWVESEQGKGSTFSFSIEAEVARSLPTGSEIPDKSVENLAEQHPLRILVAEDVPSNQMVLVEMLKRMGYRADMAADGIEVLQALERRPYDMVLMDVKMTEMDGIAAAKEIRRLSPNNGPKIVAITAYAMDGDREKCLEAGMDDYIAKPVQKWKLAEVLKRCAQDIKKVKGSG